MYKMCACKAQFSLSSYVKAMSSLLSLLLHNYFLFLIDNFLVAMTFYLLVLRGLSNTRKYQKKKGEFYFAISCAKLCLDYLKMSNFKIHYFIFFSLSLLKSPS